MEHKQIWAPWRLEYILDEHEAVDLDPSVELLPGADRDCFLCQGVAAGDDDRKRLVVARGQRTVTILNRYPYNNGHLLIAPQRHVARLDQLDDQLQLELGKVLVCMIGLLEKVLRPEGFNVGLNLGRVAGAGLPGHLHWHVVPRWTADTNFMPTVAGVRVIPQSLDALWQLLTVALAEQK